MNGAISSPLFVCAGVFVFVGAEAELSPSVLSGT
jgi:hypothetical protein